MTYKIGVDGGGTKTSCILIDSSGHIVGQQHTTGCNPNIVGRAAAETTLTSALAELCEQVERGSPSVRLNITDTLLCMAGTRGFWQELGGRLPGFGRVVTVDDSHPILELATNGRPGLVLHSGTGSFVAARAPDGSVHYAGGRGWRFGDPGSGYDLGMRAVARGLLELQGWASSSKLGPAVRTYSQAAATADASAVTRSLYQNADPAHIAAFAPTVLQFAADGDAAAREIVVASTGALLDLAEGVAARLFLGTSFKDVAAGLSGPILTHPLVRSALAARSPMQLKPIAGTPIEGVRQMLVRL